MSIILWHLHSPFLIMLFHISLSFLQKMLSLSFLTRSRLCTVLFLLSELGTAYVSATTGAVATALGLNALTKVLGFLFP